jgi:hypothetical protein
MPSLPSIPSASIWIGTAEDELDAAFVVLVVRFADMPPPACF